MNKYLHGLSAKRGPCFPGSEGRAEHTAKERWHFAK